MIYLEDSDFTLHLGDVLTVLREMPSESVDCVITSPPYWGLRDYGTGAWEGGEEGCDHKMPGANKVFGNPAFNENRPSREATQTVGYRDTCGKCGATRQDAQLGLEPTPEQYVERMTEVFREVRRVLAKHGTCWLNMGDSYAGAVAAGDKTFGNPAFNENRPSRAATKTAARALAPGLKPKDLCGVPWRLAFALQADGWYLRSDIVWSKPNPMPESVTDRPTKAHEYVFLLTKAARYFFDQEAVREPLRPVSLTQVELAQRGNIRDELRVKARTQYGGPSSIDRRGGGNKGAAMNPAGRNIRSVWEIATQPYPEAHFATFPEELVRRCLLAGCPEQVCGECGKARERVVSDERVQVGHGGRSHGSNRDNSRNDVGVGAMYARTGETVGFTDCGHDAYHPGTVLDIFMGSGTTALVARKHGRRAVGIELNAEYCELIVKRTQQLSLLSELA